MQGTPLISAGILGRDTLRGQLALVSGAGGGLGFEAARSLAWLGARVVIAEVNKHKGEIAEQQINTEMGTGSATFVHTDIGDEHSVARMVKQVARLGSVDIILNNATVAPVGAVHDVSVQEWDRSYRVNLRGPVLLARSFLPSMIERRRGVVVSVSSSGAAPFMGPYEVYKTAQVELANTLAAELENTGVYAFTIGPGLIPDTPGASAAIAQIAPLYGKTVAEFNAMSQNQIISAEAAGAGFAAAIALAAQFHGQEIGSIQALQVAGISLAENARSTATIQVDGAHITKAITLCRQVHQTLVEQTQGWHERPLFERQWAIRDFRKATGMPAEQWLDALNQLETELAAGDNAQIKQVPLQRLAGYYSHLEKLAKGYEKDQAKLAANLQIISGWQSEVVQLIALLDEKDGSA